MYTKIENYSKVPIATQLFNINGNQAIYKGIYDGVSSIGNTSGYTDFLILDNPTTTEIATVVDGWTWTPGSGWSGAAWYQIRDGVSGYLYAGFFKDNDNNTLFMLVDSSGSPGIALATVSKKALLFDLPTN